MGQVKLSVLYRACHLEVTPNSIRNPSRPDWFDKKKCFKSFYNSFGDKESVDITVVFDGNKDHELARYISKFKVDIIYLNEVGNKESLIFCYNLMGKLEGKFCGLFEDDYLWLPYSYEILMEGLEKFGEAGTLSLYQHPDRLTRTDDVTLGSDFIFNTPSCYWRTAESNTATFAIRRDLFNGLKQEFIDCNIHDRLLFVSLLQKYNLRHFTPVSDRFGCSHCNQFFLSYFVNWAGFNNSIII
jgi:hypothetical protein